MTELSTVLESVMRICFGISWPLSIVKALRTKEVVGKSLLFMSVIFAGYLRGINAKLMGDPTWLIGLYAINAILVSIDIALYLRYSKRSGGNSIVCATSH